MRFIWTPGSTEWRCGDVVIWLAGPGTWIEPYVVPISERSLRSLKERWSQLRQWFPLNEQSRNILWAAITSNIINEWIIGKTKGIVGMFFHSGSAFCTWFLTCAGPFDEAARIFLSQHPDVECIDRNGIVTTAAQSQQSVALFLWWASCIQCLTYRIDAPSGLQISSARDSVVKSKFLPTSHCC